MQVKGQYTSKLINFERYTVPYFNPIPFGGFSISCGDSIFFLLTGKHLDYPYIRNDSTSDRIMVSQLRQSGYTVIPLSIAAVLNQNHAYNNITKDHVLLLSQLYIRGEGSWSVIYNNLYNSNFSKKI